MSRTFVLDDNDAPAIGLDLASELNEEQRAVVNAGTGPLLVIAGAGTGKTRALTYRVAQLIARGTRPDRILLLTFTNRAASEMVGRVRTLVGQGAGAVWGGTFHSVGRRVLGQHGDRLGYPSAFGILDREDSESLMKQCISEVVADPTKSRFPRARVLVNTLSSACNTGRSALDLFVGTHPKFAGFADEVGQVFVKFQGRKFEYGVMDFDDLLVNWRRLMLEHEDVRESLSSRFEHVLVDEYQDTNAIQAELVDLCASRHGNLTVVGDDCQSIYSFRGAEFRNILEFPERHAGTTVMRLETNYRSTPEVLALANASIERNVRQFPKHLRAVRAQGYLPGHVRCTTEDEQSRFVAQRILQLREEDVPLDRIAVLYRAHWQSMALQIELGRRNIPYRVHSGQRFFEQRHIKDVLSFLRFAQNPRDELAFVRLATLFPGIGHKTAAALFTALRSRDDLREGLRHAGQSPAVSRRSAAGWSSLAAVLDELIGVTAGGGAAEALDLVVNRFYEEHALRSFDNAENRTRDLVALAELASRYASVEDFLQEMALAGEVSGVDQLSAEPGDESVVLSSIHQSKGLEFHTVFVLWVTEDRFPSARASGDEIEEERRLFYVAVTRAEQELYLTSPVSSWERGVGLVTLRDSIFVRELEREIPPVLERIELVRRQA